MQPRNNGLRKTESTQNKLRAFFIAEWSIKVVKKYIAK